MELRSYQQECVDSNHRVLQQGQSALDVLATGTGKTVIGCHTINDAPGRVMWVAHRDKLIKQAAEKIEIITGEAPDVEMASSWASRMYKADCVVSSIQTLCRGRFEDFDPNDFSHYVLDEAHHCTSRTNRKVIDHFRTNPNCKILGLTATPDRADEEALGQVFENVAYDYGIVKAINDGWLVSPTVNEVFVEGLDISGVSTRAGDLASNELARILEFEEVVHGMASSIVQIAGERKTLIFTESVAQCERMTEILNRHKPNSANYIIGKTANEVKDRIYSEFAEGCFQFLVNVMVATEGFDDPNIEVIALCRPTKSRSLMSQMVGRGTRPHDSIAYDLNRYPTPEGRKGCIEQSPKQHVEVLDFVGNAGRHKLVHPVDILGGNYSDEVLEQAQEAISKKRNEPVDMASELQKAEWEIKQRHKEAIEAAQRSGLALRAAFSIKNVDPFDVLGIVQTKSAPWGQSSPASSAQKQFLSTRNIDASKLNKFNASELIGAIKEREVGMFPFGKHAGTPIKQVPRGYLNWFIRQEWSKNKRDLRAEVCKVLGIAG